MLPPPAELAARIAEARTSAQLLTQVVQSTPPTAVAGHELLAEFAERCGAAARSVQAYIAADEPAPPDPDTLLTLIETNDQLAAALSRHQRAVLAARRYDDRTGRVAGPPRLDSGASGASGAMAEAPTPPPNDGARSPPPTAAKTRSGSVKGGGAQPVAKKGPVPWLNLPRKPLRKKSDTSAASGASGSSGGPPNGTAPTTTTAAPPAPRSTAHGGSGAAIAPVDNPFADRHRAPGPDPSGGGLASARAGADGAAAPRGPPPPLPLKRGTVREGVLVDADGAPLATATGGLDLSPEASPQRARNPAQQQQQPGAGSGGPPAGGGRTQREESEDEDEVESPVQVRQYRF